MERQKARSQQRNDLGIALVGRCAHSIGKFFLCYIVLFSSETSAQGFAWLFVLFAFGICSFFGLRFLFFGWIDFFRGGGRAAQKTSNYINQVNHVPGRVAESPLERVVITFVGAPLS